MNSSRYPTPEEAARRVNLKKLCGGDPELMKYVDRACRRLPIVQALEDYFTREKRRANDRRRKAVSRYLQRVARDLGKDMTTSLHLYKKHAAHLHPKEAMQVFADKQLQLWLEGFNRSHAGTLSKLALKGYRPQLTAKKLIVHIHSLCKEASGLTDNAVSTLLARYLKRLRITKRNGSPFTRQNIRHYLKTSQ